MIEDGTLLLVTDYTIKYQVCQSGAHKCNVSSLVLVKGTVAASQRTVFCFSQTYDNESGGSERGSILHPASVGHGSTDS